MHGSETLQPTAGYDVCYTGEDAKGGSTWNNSSAGLGWGTMDAGTEGDGGEDGSCRGTGEDDVRREAEDEREMETGGGGGTAERMGEACVERRSIAERVTAAGQAHVERRSSAEERMRSVLGSKTGRDEIREAVGKARVEVVGDRVGGDQVVMLLTDHTEAQGTAAARATEWRAFCEYREETGREDLASGVDMVCFVGWLCEERSRGKRKVSSRSLPQYLSAVRTMHGKLGLPLPPSPSEFFPLQQVLRAYRNWESSRFPMNSVRVGLSAAVLKKLWERGMDDNASLVCVRDVAMVVFAFVFGLRESSVMGIRVDDVRVLTARKCEVIVRKVKGRTSEEALRRGPRVYAVPEEVENPTPLSVLEKFVSLRSSSSEFLFSPELLPLDG